MKVIVTPMARVTPVDRVVASVTVGAVEDWHRDNNYRALVYHNQSTVLLYKLCHYVTGSGKTAEFNVSWKPIAAIHELRSIYSHAEDNQNNDLQQN